MATQPNEHSPYADRPPIRRVKPSRRVIISQTEPEQPDPVSAYRREWLRQRAQKENRPQGGATPKKDSNR